MSTTDILIVSADEETINRLLPIMPTRVWHIHRINNTNNAIGKMSKDLMPWQYSTRRLDIGVRDSEINSCGM